MSFFRAAKSAFNREIKQIRKSVVLRVLMFVLPLLSLLFFALFFQEGVAENIPIAVCDYDKSTLSRKLTSMIGATPSANVCYNVSSTMEGEQMVKRGDIQAFVLIPEGFEQSIYNTTKTEVVAYISGLNLSANGMLSKDIQTAVTTFSSGIQIQMLQKGGMSEKQAYVAMMPISFDKHILFNPYVNYGYYLLPSFMPMMLMIFTILLTILAIGQELKYATAGEWMKSADNRVVAALIGKLLPYTLTLIFLSIFMNVIMYTWSGIPLNGSSLVLYLSTFVLVLAYQAVAIFIVTLVSNLRLALSLGGGYSVLAFTFSGLTFPLIAMEWWIKWLSYIFPFTFYTDVFIDQALRGAPVVYSLKYIAYILIFVVLPIVLLPRLKKIATDSSYWGKL